MEQNEWRIPPTHGSPRRATASRGSPSSAIPSTQETIPERLLGTNGEGHEEEIGMQRLSLTHHSSFTSTRTQSAAICDAAASTDSLLLLAGAESGRARAAPKGVSGSASSWVTTF